MKKTIALILVLAMATILCACGATSSPAASESATTQSGEVTTEPVETEIENEPVIEEPEIEEPEIEEPKDVFSNETDYVLINGIFIDDSYVDKDNSKIKMVYVFYDAFTNAENIEVSSELSELTINDINTYYSEKYSGVCDYMNSYYYSDYLEEVFIGDTLKVVATFKIPEAEFAPDRIITLAFRGIPDTDSLKISTNDVIHCDSQEEIAQTVDPAGYSNYMHMYEEADENTTNTIKSLINGYYWTFYVNSTTYELEFFAPNAFETRVKALGVTNGGSYVVRNGFVSITYDSNGKTVDIPYTIENDDIALDVITAFDVH